MSDKEEKNKVGLFTVSYEIGDLIEPGLGGVLFYVNLTVSTPNERVNGIGHINQNNPPLNIGTELQGGYTQLVLPPGPSQIFVNLSGLMISPHHGPIRDPLAVVNCELTMVLSEDWKSGTANYKYLHDGKWQKVTDAPVKSVQTEIGRDAAA